MISIYLLTDFGNDDYYVGAMKGVIRSICPNANILTISNGVRKFNVKHGAFLLWQAIKWIEEGSIVLGVVDPGVGTARDPIIIRANSFTFVGPDNGLFWPAIEELGDYEVYKIDLISTGLYKRRTGTFDGRDVFAPIAAYIACGKSLDELGFPKRSIEIIDLWKVDIKEGYLKGEVMNVDRFGNIVTNIKWDALRAERARIKIKNVIAQGCIAKNYSGKGVLMLNGSTGLLEISLARGSAAKYFEADIGDPISLEVIK